MRKSMQKKWSLRAVCFLSCGWIGMFSGLAGADVVISDSFDLSSPDREAGDTLNGVTTMDGGKTWTADTTKDVLFADNGGDGEISAAYGNYRSMAVDFDFSDYTAIGDTAKTSLTFSFAGNINDSNWMALVFGRNDAGALSNGKALLQIYGDGDWVLREAGSSGNQISGTSSSYGGASGDFTVELVYNELSQMASAKINGVTVADNFHLNGLSGTTSHIFIHQQFVGLNVDDFEVSVIPEPTSVGLMVISSVALLGARRLLH